MNFLTELKRRNVIRMAGLYLVGAWLVVQVAATLLPVFDAPGWVMKTLVVLLVIGFGAALVLSWAFEWTPGGLKRDSEVPANASDAPQTAQRMDRWIIVALTLALGYFVVDKFVISAGPAIATAETITKAPSPEETAPPRMTATTASINDASIAVLPFVNMSTDTENGFFADGISEELLNVLAGVDGLKVASRTSSFSFKDKDTAIPEIARQLGVRHVLEGSVRKQGNRVRITAQLIHADTDGHLWSESYDRDLTDIFKVQEEIARAITRELEGLLGKRQVAVAASTDNLEAYQNFLRGRARFHRRDELIAAIDDLTRAVTLDPEFGEAWLYLAATWVVIPGYHQEHEVQAAKARASALGALDRTAELLPDHPMIPALRSYFLEEDGDYVGALAGLQLSASLSVQDSTPRMWQGILLLRTGHVAEATAAFEDASAMDPLSGINNGYLAIAYLSAGRDADAEATARKAFSQGWVPALNVLVFDLVARGERERAVAMFDELISPTRSPEDAAGIRAVLLDPGKGEVLLTQRPDITTTHLEFPIAIRRFDLLLDRAEQVQQQDRASRRRQWWLRSAWLPSARALREDPRFFAIARDMGVARLWETRGWPDGCTRVSGSGGDHLRCANGR